MSRKILKFIFVLVYIKLQHGKLKINACEHQQTFVNAVEPRQSKRGNCIRYITRMQTPPVKRKSHIRKKKKIRPALEQPAIKWIYLECKRCKFIVQYVNGTPQNLTMFDSFSSGYGRFYQWMPSRFNPPADRAVLQTTLLCWQLDPLIWGLNSIDVF